MVIYGTRTACTQRTSSIHEMCEDSERNVVIDVIDWEGIDHLVECRCDIAMKLNGGAARLVLRHVEVLPLAE